MGNNKRAATKRQKKYKRQTEKRERGYQAAARKKTRGSPSNVAWQKS